MRQTCEVVMLPTEKASKLVLTDNKLRGTPYEGDVYQAQHLYIVLDKEIKEGDWVYDKVAKFIKQATKHTIVLIGKTNEYYLKVMASTDKEITPTALLPNNFIASYIKSYNEDRIITLIDIELYKPNAAYQVSEHWAIKTRGDKKTIYVYRLTPSFERETYTREQVDDLIHTICYRLRRGAFKDNDQYLSTMNRIKNEDYQNWINNYKK